MSNKTDSSRPPGLRIGQVLLTHVEFSHTSPEPLRMSHDTPHKVTSLEVGAQLKVTPDKTRAVLTVRVRTGPKDADALYRFDVGVTALLLTVEGEENLRPDEYLTQAGMSLLYPFLRETIANITMRGRFGPVWLQPINLRLFADARSLAKPTSTRKAKRTKKPSRKKARATAKRTKAR